MTDTRDDFEACFHLCSRQKWRHKDGTYVFGDIQAKWEGWQAAQLAVATQEPVAYFWRDKAEGTVGLRFTMPEWVDDPDKQRYELVPLYAATSKQSTPNGE